MNRIQRLPVKNRVDSLLQFISLRVKMSSSTGVRTVCLIQTMITEITTRRSGT